MDITSNECFDGAIGIAECDVFDIAVLTALVLNGEESTWMIDGYCEMI